MIIYVGDPVYSKRTHEKGVVIEVNNYWGWFRVKYTESGFVKTYQNIDETGTGESQSIGHDLDARIKVKGRLIPQDV